MYQLPSGDFSPQFVKSRAPASPRLGVFIGIWLILAISYGGYRMYVSRKAEAVPEAPSSQKSRVNSAAVAVWQSQVTEAEAAALQAEGNLRQAEAEVRKTLGLTDSLVEGRHLHAAMAKIEATRQGLERARYDLDSLETLLKGEEKQ